MDWSRHLNPVSYAALVDDGDVVDTSYGNDECPSVAFRVGGHPYRMFICEPQPPPTDWDEEIDGPWEPDSDFALYTLVTASQKKLDQLQKRYGGTWVETLLDATSSTSGMIEAGEADTDAELAAALRDIRHEAKYGVLP